jgi:Zn-dependent M28 family amino/carboxypeptidase
VKRSPLRMAAGALAGLTACAGGTDAALQSITAEDLLARTQALSADTFEGRAPGTPGEERTVAYLIDQFRGMGLQPGNPDGSYVQTVDLVGLTATPTASFRAGGRTLALRPLDDYVAITRRTVPEVNVQGSDLVFVGYGVVAPEYQWDDYKGVDVRGKTVVMLINDPAVPDPADSTRLDPAVFRGDAMTYYGRWTYKYEIATEKGAAAAILVHETGPAGYPYEVVKGSWGRENMDIRRPDGNAGRVAVEAWLTLEKTRELFQAAGMEFDALKRAARTREFQPVALNAKASFTIRNAVRDIPSRNVIARLDGAEGPGRDEYIVYTAHWDHLGRDTTAAGDQIYNGALDNASGTAGLLEIAEAYARLPAPPRRSILFLAVTAEEKGLLGAKYYAANPLYPLERTLADINLDGVNQWGRTHDLVVVGSGNTTLEDVLAEAAAEQGRVLAPDPEPEKGFFYRSDHFEFAKKGVPALYTDSGVEFIGKPEGYGKQKREEYTSNDYHKPSDEVKPDWDLAGAVEDLQLLFTVGHRVAQGDTWPQWKPGTEFKAVREAMLAGR